MAESAANAAGKKLIRVDVSSDSVCPWCFVGKRNLDKAISAVKDQFDFEIRWHPFFLNPSAPKEGVNKRDFYREKFGSRSEQILARMTDIFKGLGLEYNMEGLTGNTLDSHRLIYYAGQHGFDKQHDLVEELFLGYFTRAKYIGDREFLVESARKVGIEGAAEFLEDPNNGLKEVMEELEKYSANISGVPYFVINDQQKLSGGQPPEVYTSLGLNYNMDGLTGNTLDSHRLIYFAGQQGLDKQHELVEELFCGYMTQGKYIGDREFLLECASKVGVEGAAEFLEDPNNGLKEVNGEFERYSAHLSGVPYYVINNKQTFNGGLPPESWIRAFEVASQ
ncbi:Uncharacterized protein RDABS01_038051 [Bienertia sinuspersici]